MTNKVEYESAKALATKASGMYVKLSKLAPKGSETDLKALKADLTELRNAINHKEHVDGVTIIVHSKIRENLMKAFNLNVECKNLCHQNVHQFVSPLIDVY